MTKERLAAFSDGVLAVIITIMVLELKAPHGADFSALRPLLPTFLTYLLSFIYLAIYWNNHHHLLYATKRVNGTILWANIHLLFWLSLVPFTTSWMGENHFASVPTAIYGVNLLASGFAYWLLQTIILASEGQDSLLASALGHDIKGKLSILFYSVAIGLAFVQHLLALGLFVVVALMWLLPDTRIERAVLNQRNAEGIERRDTQS